MIRALLMLALVACGTAPTVAPRILPPNVEQACARALRCGAILAGQDDACVACLEHVDPKAVAKLREQYGDLPPLDTVSCDTIASVIRDWTDIWLCIAGRWFGP